MKDKVAVITGSTSGIGEDIARKFAANGSKVVVTGRNKEKGNKIINSISKNNGEAIFVKTNVSNTEDCIRLFDITRKKYGKVDILVNNAGMINNKPITDMSEKDWDDVIDVNLKSYFLCSKEAIKSMQSNEYGRIVNISSRGWLGGTAQSNYAASKGGVVSLTRSLALETAKDGITVNCVAPGMIDTELHRKSSDEEKEFRMNSQPMGKVGEPKHVTNIVEYFASEDNWFTTGQVLYVCGGMSVLASLST